MTETPDRVSVDPYSDLIDRLTLYEHREGYDGKDWEKIASEAAAVIANLAAAPRPIGEGDNTVGCAEREVGRAVYERIETLIGGTSAELDCLADLVSSVEEYGSYSGPVQCLAAPPAPSAEGGGELWEIGSWLSAALDDPKVCDEMKAAITSWFEGGGYLRQALAQPADGCSSNEGGGQ